MATSEARTEVALRLERTYHASSERVFEAWICPNAIAHWFAPSAEYTTVVTALDARPGGRYRVEMRHPGGIVHVVTGVYQELVPPTALVMMWAWEGQEAFGHTLVTVQLTPLDTGTRLVLLHEQFPSDAARTEHKLGVDRLLGTARAIPSERTVMMVPALDLNRHSVVKEIRDEHGRSDDHGVGA